MVGVPCQETIATMKALNGLVSMTFKNLKVMTMNHLLFQKVCKKTSSEIKVSQTVAKLTQKSFRSAVMRVIIVIQA